MGKEQRVVSLHGSLVVEVVAAFRKHARVHFRARVWGRGCSIDSRHGPHPAHVVGTPSQAPVARRKACPTEGAKARLKMHRLVRSKTPTAMLQHLSSNASISASSARIWSLLKWYTKSFELHSRTPARKCSLHESLLSFRNDSTFRTLRCRRSPRFHGLTRAHSRSR